jgi:hypothetical protein
MQLAAVINFMRETTFLQKSCELTAKQLWQRPTHQAIPVPYSDKIRDGRSILLCHAAQPQDVLSRLLGGEPCPRFWAWREFTGSKGPGAFEQDGLSLPHVRYAKQCLRWQHAIICFAVACLLIKTLPLN